MASIPVDENGNPIAAPAAPAALAAPQTPIVAPNSATTVPLQKSIPVDENGEPIAASHEYQNTNPDAAIALPREARVLAL